MLFSSAMDFTIKFGAFPIYVFAPMNTAPQEIAISMEFAIGTALLTRSVVACSDMAVSKNTR